MPSIYQRFRERAPKIDPRFYVVLVIALLMFAPGNTWWHARDESALSPTLTHTPTLLTPTVHKGDGVKPTPSPFPPEFLHNEEQTVGPTVAAALLVLIVVLGVVTHFYLRHRDG